MAVWVACMQWGLVRRASIRLPVGLGRRAYHTWLQNQIPVLGQHLRHHKEELYLQDLL